MAKTVTAKQVESLKTPGKVLSHSLGSGGSLFIRRLRKSTAFYYQYRHDDKLKRFPFGVFDVAGNSIGSADCTTFTLIGAKKRAQALCALVEEVGDLAEHFKAERERVERERQQAKADLLADEQDAATYSLERLCLTYCDHLDSQGKASAKDVRNALTRWVIEKQPVYAATKAREVTTQDIRAILKTIIAEGKTTTVNRVRSYLMAAYAHGAGSSLNLLADDNTSEFNITVNPVSPIPAVRKFEKAGERHLTAVELAELLRRLMATNTPAAKVVLLSLRLGAQRIRQLLAATDYDHADKVLTIHDTKGRRLQARAHVLPVPEQAEILLVNGLLDKHPRRPGLYGGVNTQTISNLVRGIGAAMAIESNTEPFNWQDVRRTAETMLSAMGISKDVRAQIQSHGISGVQAKHYDRHHYLPEKLQALTAWNTRLDELLSGVEQADNVVTLTR